MRILVLSNVPPGAVGGAEVQVMNLAKCWSKSGHQVMVAGYANHPLEERNLRVLNLSTVRTFRWARATTYLFSTLRLIWVHRDQFDIVYCRFLKEQAFAACIARKVFRLEQPVIACPAASGPGGDIWVLNRRFLRRHWIALFSRQLACINAMTQRIYTDVKAVGISGPRITRIPNGVVLAGRQALSGHCVGRIRIIFVGRLVQQKGLDVLLEAASLLQSRGYSFALEIVGDGPLRERLEALVSIGGLENIVQLTGGVSPADVGRHLESSDIFVLPSRFEGMPGSLLEAFARGLPAVVTKVSGSEEVVDEDTGWIVPPEDSEALAAALASAIDLGRDELRKMGKKSQAKALEFYDIQEVAKQYEQLFKELASKPKASST